MKFAFVFPGQGSQSVGMLNGFADLPVVQQTLQEASDALGEDLATMIAEGPKERLALTVNTQPVMLAADVAVYRAWQSLGGAAPAVVAGHSLGEYAALVAAGVLQLGDAVKLVRLRAQAMQEAVPVGTGAMAAVMGLDADKIREACAASAQGEVVEVANLNDPSQTVISGHAAAVERACAAVKAAGAKRALPLPVSAPFHCSLMLPAAERLREALAQITLQAPSIAVINNVDVAIESDPARIVDALARQAAGAVRWVETVRKIREQGCDLVAECGPGKVLAGLVKRIDGEMQSVALVDAAALQSLLEMTR